MNTIDDFFQRPEPTLTLYTPTDQKKSDTEVKQEDNATKIRKLIGRSLGIKNLEEIETILTVTDLGMDSLMSNEITTNIFEIFGVNVTSKVLRTLTFGNLKSLIEK